MDKGCEESPGLNLNVVDKIWYVKCGKSFWKENRSVQRTEEEKSWCVLHTESKIERLRIWFWGYFGDEGINCGDQEVTQDLEGLEFWWKSKYMETLWKLEEKATE